MECLIMTANIHKDKCDLINSKYEIKVLLCDNENVNDLLIGMYNVKLPLKENKYICRLLVDLSIKEINFIEDINNELDILIEYLSSKGIKCNCV